MSSYARRAGTVRSLRTVLAVVCVLLVMVSGTVQVAHSHVGGDDSHANCSLCATAHVTVHLTETQAPVVAARVVVRVEALPLTAAPSRFLSFSYFTRPPPSLNLPS
jgi:hypothetical protein